MCDTRAYLPSSHTLQKVVPWFERSRVAEAQTCLFVVNCVRVNKPYVIFCDAEFILDWVPECISYGCSRTGMQLSDGIQNTTQKDNCNCNFSFIITSVQEKLL